MKQFQKGSAGARKPNALQKAKKKNRKQYTVGINTKECKLQYPDS